MTDDMRIPCEIERGDPSAAEQLLPSVYAVVYREQTSKETSCHSNRQLAANF